jgi:hypothetical protein
MSSQSTDPRDDEELASWADDFKQGADDSPPLSPDAVIEEGKRIDRTQNLAWASQIFGILLAVANFLGIVVYTRSAIVAALSAVVLPTLLALFGWFVHLRLSVGKRVQGSVASFVAWMVKHKRADLRFARSGRLALVFLAVAFWVWFPLFVLSKVDRFGSHPSRLAFGAAFSLVVFAAAFWRTSTLVRRAEQGLAHWRKLEASFTDRA